MDTTPEVPLQADETLNTMFEGKIRIIQKSRGYRFSTDAVILARFASVSPADRVIDLGTGSGIIPLILARATGVAMIVGIEIQDNLADIARRNVALNNLDTAITIVREDITKLPSLYPPASFDCVISNPPFRKLDTGRVNSELQKSIARHEIALSLEQLLMAAFYLLKDHGRLFLIYPAFRAVDLFCEMRLRRIEPKTAQWVHGRIDMPAKMVLVEGVKEGGAELLVKEPLFLYDADGHYTDTMQKIYSLP